ncbi:P-loop containing nucleoside triphosphate hydrolase protein [Cladorrhinum samala]|uniref:P-loop containing nucleoside triphosphate hydrolase protein n=1 Tax=Cladorrhinum samala TaxID=585594 RepID=A0AAV9HF87_9PEZI|nr:P-loop containing nucleoside triphosphate hydrolase protein [Cladorrhinum samala]
MSAELDSSAMQQLEAEQRALLDTVDELRKLGLQKMVDLPQLIVVGDQSSGKSSVLEAISRVRFPIKDGLCTRFATELVLRQSESTKVQVTIQNDSHLDEGPKTGFSKDSLSEIIEESKRLMGVGDGSSSFTENVLRIEISGPDVPQLTLVDLPGFYHSGTENQEADGVEIVNRLADRYMRQESSIILAVISAKNELAAQKVLAEAQKHDPKRTRTLGIITKPDRVDAGGHDESKYLQLAQNQEPVHKLALGWHVLRNRSHLEAKATDEERDETEKQFFQQGVWSVIRSQDRGIDKLRGKLSAVLLAHIQQKLPGVISQIERLIKQAQTRRDELGDHRWSPQEMRTYLSRISSRFRDLAETLHILHTKGHRRHIKWEDGDDDGDAPELPTHLESVLGLWDAVETPEGVSFSELQQELEIMSSENQGTDFAGSANDRLTLRLFRDQSQPWEVIANRHIALMTDLSKGFAERLVLHVAGGDSKTANALLRTYVDPYFDDKMRVMGSKVEELVYHYKHGYDPQPLYTPPLSDRRRDARAVRRGTSALMETYPNLRADGLTHESVARAVLQGPAEGVGLSGFGTDKIIDTMLDHYKTTLRMFADNVAILAVENCLIRDIPRILTPEAVAGMTDEEVERIAAESKEVRDERNDLESRLAKLQEGLHACQRFQPRDSASSEYLPTYLPTPCPSLPRCSLAKEGSTNAQGASKANPISGTKPIKSIFDTVSRPKPDWKNLTFSGPSPNSKAQTPSGGLSRGPSAATPPNSSNIFAHLVSTSTSSDGGELFNTPLSSSKPPTTSGGLFDFSLTASPPAPNLLEQQISKTGGSSGKGSGTPSTLDRKSKNPSVTP